MFNKNCFSILLLLKTVVLVSSISFRINLKRSNSTGIWEQYSGDYHDLDNENPLQILKPGTYVPYNPVTLNLQVFAFLKLVITAPSLGSLACNQDLNVWLRTVNLDMDSAEMHQLTHGPIPHCVGANLSVVGIYGSWSIPKSFNSSKDEGVPFTLKYLIGGTANIQIFSSIANSSNQGTALYKPTHISNKWTNFNVDSNSGKVTVEATVESNEIMLLLDVIKFETHTIFQANNSPLNLNFDWQPNHLIISEKRKVTQVALQPLTYVLSVRKAVNPKFKSDIAECLEPVSIGKCSSHKERYYYESDEMKCKPFIYSGCGGNKNNFFSIKACKSKCEVLARNPDRNFRINDICFQQPLDDSKGCSIGEILLSNKYHWYYDPNEGVCHPFIYNCADIMANADNIFSWMRKCVYDCRYAQDLCSLPVVPGECNERIPLYYYDRYENNCRAFNYSGCYGNANMFDDVAQCEQRCKKSTNDERDALYGISTSMLENKALNISQLNSSSCSSFLQLNFSFFCFVLLIKAIWF